MPGAVPLGRDRRVDPDGEGAHGREGASGYRSFVYPGAGHGFTCDHRASYDEKSAELAYKRSMEFFAKHIG